MARYVTVAAAQMGPVQKEHTREQVVERLITLLRQAHSMGAELVVFPELALTTFFPRWFVDDIATADHWYERSMPNAATQPLFDEAKRLGVGFCLGYALIDEQGHRWNVQTLVERDGSIVATYKKTHIPGHEHHEPDRPFQHAERYYFEPSPEGFGVWRAFGGLVGMAICNDRRWPEAWRVLADLMELGVSSGRTAGGVPVAERAASIEGPLLVAAAGEDRLAPPRSVHPLRDAADAIIVDLHMYSELSSTAPLRIAANSSSCSV